MGLIRLLLSFSVVIAHSNPVFGNKLIGGAISVRAFFIISGFYMALILNEKYVSKDSYKLFITNRLLRLYPVYWIMLGLTIILGFLAVRFSNHPIFLAPYFTNSGTISFMSWICLIISNIGLVGLDWFLFLGFNEGNGHFFFSPEMANGWHFIVVTQAWSIGIEIAFYLIAPFLVRRKWGVLLIIVACSLLLRMVMYSMGYNKDPWTYRFFPLELGFFLIGTLGYKVYRFLKTKNITRTMNIGMLLLMVGFTICFQYVPIEKEGKEWIYYSLIAITTPFLFLFTKNNKLDYLIGELTYPVYMCHVFIFVILGYLNKFTGIGPQYSGLVTIAGSVLFSLLLIKFIIDPVEKIRQNRVKQIKLNN